MAGEKKAEAVKDKIVSAISVAGEHACRNDPDGICPVTSAISDDLIFVNNKKYPQCPRYIPFGYGGFCSFPARKELYKKYKI